MNIAVVQPPQAGAPARGYLELFSKRCKHLSSNWRIQHGTALHIMTWWHVPHALRVPMEAYHLVSSLARWPKGEGGLLSSRHYHTGILPRRVPRVPVLDKARSRCSLQAGSDLDLRGMKQRGGERLAACPIADCAVSTVQYTEHL